MSELKLIATGLTCPVKQLTLDCKRGKRKVFISAGLDSELTEENNVVVFQDKFEQKSKFYQDKKDDSQYQNKKMEITITGKDQENKTLILGSVVINLTEMISVKNVHKTIKADLP